MDTCLWVLVPKRLWTEPPPNSKSLVVSSADELWGTVANRYDFRQPKFPELWNGGFKGKNQAVLWKHLVVGHVNTRLQSFRDSKVLRQAVTWVQHGSAIVQLFPEHRSLLGDPACPLLPKICIPAKPRPSSGFVDTDSQEYPLQFSLENSARMPWHFPGMCV